MRALLLYFVVALFAWMGFALLGGSGDTPLAPGFLLLMAALSVALWDRFIAPRKRTVPKSTPAVRQPARPVTLREMAPPVPQAPGYTVPTRAGVAAPMHWRPLSA